MFIKEQLSEKDQLALMFQAVESARNGIVITDPSQPDNPIIYTNPAFTEITGYQSEDILGRNCRFLQNADREQKARFDIRKALDEGQPITTILRNYRKDGRRFFNELTISPVRNHRGEIVAFVGVQNDITARIEAEERISNFYSIVSHELRTPIAKMKSALAIVNDGEAGPVPESVLKFVGIATRAAESLWRLLENILDFKKLESGAFRLLLQKLNLSQLVESAVAEFQPVGASASLSIKYESPAKPTVNADGQRIVQVLDNLLNNAVRFSPAGAEILVRLTLRDEWARVEIIDQGPGIAQADIVRLFDKFQQLDSPDQRTRGGTGLGLAVCKALIEAHGGNIGVVSEPGAGSVFWFELAVAG